MKSLDLNSNWSVTVGERHFMCSLPYDATADVPKDMSCAFGASNGYVPAERAVLVKALPQIKHGLVSLVVSGACGFGDVFVNDEKIGTLCSYAPTVFRLDGALAGAHNTLRIELFSAPGMTDKYCGLGIAGGVELKVFDPASGIGLSPMFVRTSTVGDRTYADVELDVYNLDEKPFKGVIECLAQNARGKRAGKKQRKVFLRAGQAKTLDIRVRINNPYAWLPTDPYMYTMTAKLVRPDGSEDGESSRFGLVTRGLSASRGLYLNNKRTQLFGAYVSHADAAVGGVSLYCNELRRLSALKQIGYNAVHFVGTPAKAALDACDDLGMYAYVDILPALVESKVAFCGASLELDVDESVKLLRNHPSVALYGVADDVPECYDRNGGHAVIKYIAEQIYALDDTRPVTVSTRELVPTFKEFEAAGYKKLHYESAAAAINAGREKNLFDELTAGAFASVDVCGLNYLYQLYEGGRKEEKLLVGSRTSSAKAFESIDATEKNDRVIGDFNDCGIDYPGGGEEGSLLTVKGDLDALCCPKPQAEYKRILLGARNACFLTSVDPESREVTHTWNWTRYLGQKIEVRVYTSGDVVALYHNGRIVGRKLAGKINKHIATFKVDYYPGTLEAVAYFKGVECARATLRSAGSPKAIKLGAYQKNLSLSRGDLGFVYVDVCDRDGELVTYARRELSVNVTGGTLVSFVNADPFLRKLDPDSCPAYGGRALAVIRPDAGETKAVVKVTGDGLLGARISFKIKN